ncbi:galactokinase [Acholeplasma vituli]|uniref:Galactokinase n=1 Tax=Paracholeplasma vituli TaxID=69473 RepID=A0ABT2PX11_9MOLU|nr:galactokinase [Paracholeplasma vituli]MCU0104869.1 galactokinase [Paracholeplasma vituli]
MELKPVFEQVYQTKPERLYYSPGRVNLIGEHIDYNGGLVFPAAISIGTYAAIRERNDHTIRFYSSNFSDQGIVTVTLDDLAYHPGHGWVNYAKGIIDTLLKRGYHIPHGLDILIEGNLPPTSGLSSSASLEVLVGYVFSDVFDLEISRETIALIGQEVENNYMGMHCGIMDQLIIAKGLANQALIMNTKTLATKPVNASFDGYTWVIMNTNYKRKNTDSKYNERVAECQAVLKRVQTHVTVETLCEITPLQFESLQYLIEDPILVKRFKHVVTEQARVIEAEKRMAEMDAKGFGALLNASHASLKNDYEVTGLHLDVLVEGAIKAGAIGSRVTGAGFGGCAIALVPNPSLKQFETLVKAHYIEKTGLTPAFYDVLFTDGVKRIE